MTSVLSAADLLGRQAELAGVASLLDGPGGGAMVVLGEAGSGKTALLEAAAALAEDRQVRVLRVTGYGPANAGSSAGGPGAAEVGDACLRLLRHLNSRQRTLAVVDDLQWLDAESVRALSALCRRLQVTDIDLLIAVRGQAAPEELGIRTREYPLAPSHRATPGRCSPEQPRP